MDCVRIYCLITERLSYVVGMEQTNNLIIYAIDLRI